VGAEWLYERTAAILADDMGLGKTLQAITALRRLVHNGSVRWAIVVCPRTLVTVWEDELARWAPELARLRIIPRGSARGEVWRSLLGRVHVGITNYEQLRGTPDTLASRGVDVLIADEAHRIRNLRAQVTQGLKGVRRERLWALTGTPIERDAEDLATLLSLLDARRFAASDARLPASVLRSRARNWLLRRRKADVLDQLPAVTDTTESLDLLPEQRAAYLDVLRGSSADPRTGDDLLKIINALRQVCDYDPNTGRSAKIDRILEILEGVANLGEKAVVFSTFLEPLRLLATATSQHHPRLKVLLLTGDMGGTDREATLNEFKDNSEVLALLASSRVAGEGLSLTEANHVLFLNQWWNPSSNAQARDRVVRIGQRRGVRVYRFVSRGTIEESVERILEKKQKLFDSVVDELAGRATDERALRELFRDARDMALRSTS
jgi:SNF2 family DNA or RNA helicase